MYWIVYVDFIGLQSREIKKILIEQFHGFFLSLKFFFSMWEKNFDLEFSRDFYFYFYLFYL